MIADLYQSLLAQRTFYRRYYLAGISPSNQQRDGVFSQAASSMPGVQGSEIQFSPDPRSEGLASTIQKTLDTTRLELSVVRGANRILAQHTRELFDRAESDLSIMGSTLSDLLVTICGLGVARQHGLSHVYADSFSTFLGIDQFMTSTALDAESQSAHLRPRPHAERIDLLQLGPEKFDAFVVSPVQAIPILAGGSQYRNAVDDADSYWLHQVHTDTSTGLTFAFQVELQNEVEISSLSLAPFGAGGNGLDIRVLASRDGATWRELLPRRRSSTARVLIDSVTIVARWIRIEMARSIPSYTGTQGLGQFVYEFGLNDLRISSTRYYPVGTLTTLPITFQDNTGTDQPIHRVRLQVFEEKPAGTEIQYFILPDGTDAPTTITPGTAIEIDTVPSISLRQAGILRRYDTTHAIINAPIEATVVPETLRFFRNVYQRGILIDGIASGWRYEDGHYHCQFENFSKVELDFGPYSIELDGILRRGLQIIAPGIHRFRTHETQWRSVSAEDHDPLYPHNHKLLIEGLRGSATYVGVDFVAAEELQLISARDLTAVLDPSDYGYFAIHDGYPMIKISPPPNDPSQIPGWRYERHAVRYSYCKSLAESIASVQLIARLSSSHSRLTPYFKGFVLMAGH